ncbi:phosphatidylinositol 3-kinase C2 domain-containing subunit gamma [Discoglossus pictus]
MAYGFQPGFLIPDTNINPAEHISGYSYPGGQFETSYIPGFGLQGAVFSHPPNVSFETQDQYMDNTMPPPWPYGFLSANWLEEQQSWRPEPPSDNGTPNEQQGFGGSAIGFESFGGPWLHDGYCPSPEVDLDTQYNGSRIHTLPPDTQTSPQIPNFAADQRRFSMFHAEDVAWTPPNEVADNDLCMKRKTRSQSLYLPHAIPGPVSYPSVGPQAYPWPAMSPDRSPEVSEFHLKLVETATNLNSDLAEFCDSVKTIRSRYSSSDPVTNSGRIWSVAFPYETAGGSAVTVTVYGDHLPQPVTCVQRGSALVQDVISDVLHQISQDPPGDGLLSICGLDEYLQNDYTLINHRRLERGTHHELRLHLGPGPGPPLARTFADDLREFLVEDFLEYTEYWKGLRDRLWRALTQYGDQAKHLVYNELQVANVTEAVKDVCYTLGSVETLEVRDAINALHAVCLRSVQTWHPNSANTAKGELHTALIQLSRALASLINLFASSFHTDFLAEPSGYLTRSDHPTDARFTFHLYAAHNLPNNWLKSNSVFSVSCSLIYAGRRICSEATSSTKTSMKSLFSLVMWNEEITFSVPVLSLPYESMLFIKLCGTSDLSPRPVTLAWTCLPLYSRQRLVRGPVLLHMMSHLEPPPVITPGAFDVTLPSLVSLQVDFLERDITFTAPQPGAGAFHLTAPQSGAGTFHLTAPQPGAGAFHLTAPQPGAGVFHLTAPQPGADAFHLTAPQPGADAFHHQIPPEDPRDGLEIMVHRNSVLLLSEADKHALWRHRLHYNSQPNLLPLVLGSCPGWDPGSISAMYTVLTNWTFHDPLEALGLLNPCFSDHNIREVAGVQIGRLSNDELLQHLPQLVQAIKFEWTLNNSLVRLLLDRSLQSIAIATRLYWLVTDAQNQPHYRAFYKTFLSALQFCAGKPLNDEFQKQKHLIKILQEITEKVKTAQDSKRQETLQTNLTKLERFFQEVQMCRLPQDPALIVNGIERSTCSYFKSNATPLKISFINADPLGKNINVIFKAGDDLRQDMLVLQIIDVMDRIWLREGLDLRMITYRCLSTGTKQGLVQMVPRATTLAKIHQQSGLLGPLKEGTIKKWFGSDDKQASENFFYSCAGWCVVTFILGVCDRHNDNIMITDTGHVFHIDFGKFLGHSQKFGSIKRDRAPFIFTTEMEYFITEGGRNPQRSQEFVELCCRAYNTLRRHSHLLINLLELMLQAGLPELCGVEDLRYMHQNLRPQDSDLQATSYFTRKIEESLQCLPVKLNNMVHILANMSTSQINISDSPLVNPKKFIKKAAEAGIRKLHEKSGQLLSRISDEEVSPGRSRAASHLHGSMAVPGVQLHISFTRPKLSVLLKHLKNVYLPDGSSPTASVEVSLLRDLGEKTENKIKARSKSADPTFNEIVEFYIQELRGYVLRLVVKSKGIFIAAVNIRLDTAPLNEDVWYPMGRCMA